jgi:hypothetical protein
MARVIYLRPEGDEIADALSAAAAADLRSVNSYALDVLAKHLRDAGFLE